MKHSTYTTVRAELQEVVDGIGNPKIVLHAHVNNMHPVIIPTRRVPHAIVQPIKKELDRMEAMGVFAKIEEPASWVSNAVKAINTNKQLRICLDSPALKNAIQREHFPMPHIEDVMEDLQDARVFSKVDFKAAFGKFLLARKLPKY